MPPASRVHALSVAGTGACGMQARETPTASGSGTVRSLLPHPSNSNSPHSPPQLSTPQAACETGSSAPLPAFSSHSRAAQQAVAFGSALPTATLPGDTMTSRRKARGNGKGKGKASEQDADAARELASGQQCDLPAAAGKCAAVDRWEEECAETVLQLGRSEGGGQREYIYCAVHSREFALLLQEYLETIKSLQGEQASELCIDPLVIAIEGNLDVLEGWEVAARGQWRAIDKAIKTRRWAHVHFGARANEFGGLSGLSLKRSAEMYERAVDMINHRSYTLILESEDAAWLLPPATPAFKHPPCTSGSTSSLRPPCAPPLQTESEEPDPILAIERVRRLELLEFLSLVGSHASFIKCPRTSVERVRIIECLFRRLISRDETLLVRAFRSKHDHVLRFFEDGQCCTLKELDRLWSELQRTEVEDLREAVTDSSRAIAWEESGAGETEEGDEGAGLQLLGGWIYQMPALGRPMGISEWGHLYALCGCPGCALRCCSTFEEWARNRRLSVVPFGKSPPPYLYWGEQKETDSAKIFRALDVVVCAEDRMGESEIRRVSGGFVGSRGKGVFVERQERNWVLLKMSVNHPKAIGFVTAVSSLHVVLCRDCRRPTEPPICAPLPPSSHLWFSRHRSATAKSDLKHHAWQIDPEGFGPLPSSPASVLESLDTLETPETQQKMERFEQVYEILVLDGFGRDGEGTGLTSGNYVGRSWEQFEQVVGEQLLATCGLRDVKGALEFGEAESYRRGEMVWTFGNGEDDGGGKKGRKGMGEAQAGLESLRDDDLAFKLSRSLFR